MIDLHLHLDGSVFPKTIIEIAKKEKINIPSYEEKELEKYLICPSNCQSLNEYLTKFDLPGQVMQTKYGLFKVTCDLIEKLSEEGIIYAEIRFAPQLHLKKGLNQEEVVQEVLKAIKYANEKFDIKTQIILCCMRGKDNHQLNFETIKIASKYLHKGVCAVDLAGAEALFKTATFKEEFSLAQTLNIPFTIHAGESDSIESIKCAVEFGAKRIGHGIRAVDDEKFMNYLAKNKIGIELCPTSNLQTKAVKNMREYPLKTFLNHHMLATINTDNMVVSNTTLNKEFNLLQNEINLTDKEKEVLLLNSIEISFLSEEEKKILRKKVGI